MEMENVADSFKKDYRWFLEKKPKVLEIVAHGFRGG